MSKPLSFYNNINSSDNLTINASYHTQYATDKTVDKIIKLSETHKVNVQIMLIDDIKQVGSIKSLIDILSDNNVSYSGLYLFSTQTYNTNYTDDITKIYDTIFEEEKKYRYVFTDRVEYLTEREILLNRMNKFKDWRCIARTWEITTDGQIENICTREHASLTLANLNQTVKCPHASCNCIGFWDYTKYEETNNRS
jgi:hypothetical protein